MKAPLLQLGEWLQRLGHQRLGWQPELADAIQPVQVIGDASALVPPLLPPTFLVGGTFTSNVARTWCLNLQSRSPNGCFIRGFRLSGATAGLIFRFRVQGTGHTFTGSQVGTHYEMGPVPGVSVLTLGDTTAPLTAIADPAHITAANGSIMLDELIFVPPGSFFLVERDSVSAVTMHVLMNVQEIP